MVRQLGNSTWCFLLGPALLSGGAARADEAEDKAVAFFQKLGGEIKRDEGATGKPVVKLKLFNPQLTAKDLKELGGLKNLKELDLLDIKVTDAGLKHLAGLKGLKKLSLANIALDDAGLKELAGFQNLQELTLWNTKVVIVHRLV